MAAPIAIFQRNYRAGIHKFYTLGDGSSNTPLSDFVNGVPVNETLTLLGGNVGIGSTQPTELLDIKGTIRVDGNVNATNITLSGGTISGGSFSGTATQVESDLTRGTYLIGDNYNGSVATTWAVDADTAAIANKVVVRDASGDIYVANIGIGTTAVRTNLDVIGNTLISGNIGIGTSDISLGKLVVAGNIVPSACNVYDLGSSTLRWRDLYLSGNTIDLDGALISRNQEDGGLRVHTRDGVTNLVNITLNNIISSNVLVSGNIGIGTTDTSAGKLVVAGNILPSACNVYDLGTSTLRWRDLYLSGNTIDLDGTTIKKDTITAGIQIGSTNYQYTSNQYAKYISTTSNVILPSSIGTINGVSITALNKRTRTSYAAAKDCVSTWTTRNLPANNGWVSVCWAPELSLFCAVGGGGSGQRVMTSPDGINWTTRASAADNAWRSVCWAPELYLFVAVATSGTGDRVMTSPDGITWTTRTSAADNDWWSVCWAPELSLFCAVAYNNGIGNRVMTSPDGINWTTRASAADNNWRSICWAPELSLFCAVASSGTGNRVMTSPDGIIWTTQTTPTRSWYSLCWSPELSLFVALATTSSFNNNGVMTSPDGINWTIRSGAYTTSHEWWSVCWSPQMSLFVAVAYYDGGIMTSPDGIVWSMVPNMNLELFSICWSPELSIFCAVISSTLLTSGIGMPNAKSVVKALPSQMMVDARGNVGIGTSYSTYKMHVQGDINYTGTLYQNGVAFSGGGGGGSQWTTSGTDIYYNSGNVGIGTTNPQTNGLHIVGNILVGGTSNAYAKYISTTSNIIPPSSIGTINGVNITALNKRTRTSYAAAKDCVSTWTSRTSAANNVWQSVCWAPELSLFCAVAFTGTGNRVMTSPDGITWTTRTSASDNNWTSVCWAPELSLFCAVASGNGTGDRVMTSPDGITWTTQTSAADNLWRSVCWAPELSLFCAVSYDGTGDRVMTSPDGITWTIQASAADNNWTSVCWSPELSLFCAVAESGTGDRVMTSPDGITWTTQASAANNTWLSVCWAAELSLFCAVAYSGTERVMTSPDGIIWTARTVSDYEWTSVCWAPELSLFCAVSQSYITGNRVMTSPDGITWTTQTAPTNGWQSICWAAELSLFCSVCWGPNSGNRVMTSAIGMPNSKSVVKALPTQMMVNESGYVGIGTTNPQVLLHTTGDIRSPAFTGAVCFFAISTVPTGWLECNGATISREVYANLFSVIGVVWGAGDGSTTFKLPDLRGEFLRAWDNGRGVDTSRAFASAQAAAMLNHTHSGTVDAGGDHSHGGNTGGNSANHFHGVSGNTGNSGNHAHNASSGNSGNHLHYSVSSSSGGCVAWAPSTPYTLSGGDCGTDSKYSLSYTSSVPGNRGKTSENGDHSHSISIGAGGDHAHSFSVNSGNQSANHVHAITASGNHTHTFTTGNPSTGGGTETRPRNIALLACIKF